MSKDFDKQKLKASIEKLKLDEYWGPENLKMISRFCFDQIDTVVDILEILHRDEITVAYAEAILQDTYKIMCLGATL